MKKTKYLIAVLMVILSVYLCKSLFSAKNGFLFKRLMSYTGRMAINTFSPASIYDKHIYYIEREKKPAVILFGNMFPVIKFLGEYDEKSEGFSTEEGSVFVNAHVEDTDFYYIEETPSETEEIKLPEEGTKGDETNTPEETEPEALETETTVSTTADDMPLPETIEAGSTAYGKVQLPIASVHPYSMEQLSDYNFIHNSFYVIPSHTLLMADKLDISTLQNTDFSIPKTEQPCILLYHTHSQEAFADSTGEGMTIVEVGNQLEKILTEQYGMKVIHLKTEFDMLDGVLDRGRAYTYAETEIAGILQENPDIDMVIDLHRDGVNENLHFVTEINGKPTAKVMLFNGISYSKEQGDIDYLYNPYVKDSLALTYQMFVLGETYYPDFFRCIYVEAYRYNLHLCRCSMLIEAGAQTNTFEEVVNAMEPLAELIYRELSGEKIWK